MVLNRQQIKDASENLLKTLDIEVKQLGGTIRLRELNVEQLGDFRGLQKKVREAESDGDSLKLFIDVIILSAIDDTGEPCFTQDDKEWLSKKLNVKVATKIAKSVIDLIGDSDEADEELSKNSESDPTSVSDSVSP